MELNKMQGDKKGSFWRKIICTSRKCFTEVSAFAM